MSVVGRERWQRIKRLVADGAARPSAERARFLADACADDVSIREEVEALLASLDAAGDRFERQQPLASAFAEVGIAPAANPAHLAAGRRLGPYEIVDQLGAGGMGEVYRARDSRLHRDVALKVLPPALVRDPARRERFVQEARAASALEHPHIAVIHEIGDADGVTFIAMELVRGEPLADVIARGALTPARALDLAVEIAEGLARAHEIGIVHRDLKPANVMVTTEGHAKIIDFVLAKLVETLSGDSNGLTRGAPMTESGVVLGTASYMSPEQARGAPVDHRSDVFSFGIVVYEMLARQPPFRGRSGLETLHAILHDPVPPLPLVSAITEDLQRLVEKCLAKERDDRYQGMRDVVVDLRAARRRLDSSQTRGVATPPSGALSARVTRAKTWGYAAAAFVVLALAAAGAVLFLRPVRNAAVDRSQWIQLTNLDFAAQPALSPDGRMLAFIRGSGTTLTTEGQIYLKMLPDGEPVPLTHDQLLKMTPAFSPDGARIAYTVLGSEVFETWIAPTLRGEPRRWFRNVSALTWIDRDHVLFAESRSGKKWIVTSSENRGGLRDVYTDGLTVADRAYRSPDGRSVLVIVTDKSGRWLPCRLLPFDDRSTGRPIGPANAPCTTGAWAPNGSAIYLSANNGDGFHLWRYGVPDGPLEQLTSGPTEEEGVAVAPDGRSLVTSVGLRQRVVWIHDAAGERPLSLEGYAYWPLISADGRKVCYRVTRTGGTGQSSSELWVADLASGRSERLLPGQLITQYDLSADDRIVAAVPDADGKSRLWVAWLDGREPPRRIADVEGDNPRFAGTGAIVFRALEGKGLVLARYDIDGGGLAEIPNSRSGVLGNASPDGGWISAWLNAAGLSVFSTRGEAPIRVLPSDHVGRLRWSQDGSRLYLSLQTETPSAFGVGRTYVIPLAKGEILPHIPPGGFRTEADLAAIPGVQILPYADVGPGPTADTYVFSRTTITRNLYRIPLP